MARKGAGHHEFLIYLLIYSNKLAYLQLVTALVCWESPAKSHEQGYLKVHWCRTENRHGHITREFLGLRMGNF